MMNVTISNYTSMHMYGRNMIRASLYDDKGAPILTALLPILLSTVKKEGYTLTNTAEILDSVVMKFGFGA